jgi:hypothetical protein
MTTCNDPSYNNDVPLRILVLLWGPLNARNFPVEMRKKYTLTIKAFHAVETQSVRSGRV